MATLFAIDGLGEQVVVRDHLQCDCCNGIYLSINVVLSVLRYLENEFACRMDGKHL